MTSALDFLLIEAEEIRNAKDSLRGVLFGVFGAYLPVLVSIFGFAASRSTGSPLDPITERTIATVFIVAASISAMWVQYLWMEYVSYMRYYYLELLPRIYAATDQGPRRNFLAWTLPRSLRQLTPLLLFNASSYAVMLAAYCKYVKVAACFDAVDSMCLAFLAAVILSVGAVVLAVWQLGHESARNASANSSARPAQNKSDA